MSNDRLVDRNRKNALLSTGPRTDAGKAIARRNALRHGLTANPAAGVIEDPGRFRALLRRLHNDLEPSGAIEEGLIHRIAHSLWRLQRAARIDAATSEQAVMAVMPAYEQIQQWITWISDKWRCEYIEEPEPDEELRRRGQLIRRHLQRSGLEDLEVYRDEQVMRSGVAITAMMSMIETLASLLRNAPQVFHAERCEQLSWLLGDMGCFPTRNEAKAPDEYPNCTRVQRLIGEARKRGHGTPMSPELDMIIRQRLDLLGFLRTTCPEPYITQTWSNRQAAAMLPDDALLERIIRYEAHADRALHRALEALARLRGLTVERIAARLTGPGPGGSVVQVSGERTTWHGPGYSDTDR